MKPVLPWILLLGGFYAAGAIFLNNFFGRTMLPLGKPLGLIAKGPLPTAAPQVVKAAA